jgi:WD40 repeat protein
MALTADGRVALAACGDGRVRIFPLRGEVPKEFETHGGAALGIAVWSGDDGSLVLSGGDDGSLRLRNLATDRPVGEYLGCSGPVRRVVIAPAGDFVCALDGKKVRSWPARSSRVKATREFPTPREDLALSGDGAWLATCGGDAATVLDARSFTPGKDRSFKHPADTQVSAVALSADGSLLLTGDEAGTLRLWTLSSAAPGFRAFDGGHKAQILSLAFDAEGRRAVSTGGQADPTVRVWDVATGKELHVFRGHNAAVTRACFVPNAPQVVSGSLDRTVRLWGLPEG